MTIYLVKIRARYSDGWGRNFETTEELISAHVKREKADAAANQRRLQLQPFDVGTPR